MVQKIEGLGYDIGMPAVIVSATRCVKNNPQRCQEEEQDRGFKCVLFAHIAPS